MKCMFIYSSQAYLVQHISAVSLSLSSSLCFFQLHSANHSLQATPNSTIHSLVHPAHPPLVDLWNTGQMEAYQTEAGGYMGVSAVVEPSLCVPSGEEVVGTEHSPLLEQQEEEEEVKVR